MLSFLTHFNFLIKSLTSFISEVFSPKWLNLYDLYYLLHFAKRKWYWLGFVQRICLNKTLTHFYVFTLSFPEKTWFFKNCCKIWGYDAKFQLSCKRSSSEKKSYKQFLHKKMRNKVVYFILKKDTAKGS